MRMINVARLPVTAAVAMVAVVGIALLSPSSSPSATEQLPRERQTLTENGVRFSFSVPKKFRFGGWERFSSSPTDTSPGGPISINKPSPLSAQQGAEAIIYWTSFPDGDYADPCARLLGRSVGRSAAALAAAVATAPGTKLVKGPSDVTLGGHPAKHVVLKVRKNDACDPGFFYTWRDVYGGAFWRTTGPGDTIRVWIVDVDGTRLFIAAATTEQANATLRNEVHQIVQTIRFG